MATREMLEVPASPGSEGTLRAINDAVSVYFFLECPPANYREWAKLQESDDNV